MKSYGNRNRSTSPKPIKKYSCAVSLQRKKCLSEWIRFLHLKTGQGVEENIKTGLVPYKLIQRFVPNFSIKGFQTNPNNSQVYTNVHLIVNFLFSEFPHSELPSPTDILKKGSNDCWILINTIFLNYQMGEIKKSWEKCKDWYSSILKLYDIEVNRQSFIKDCLNGVFFACILNCYTGFKLTNIYRNPNSAETTKNLSQVFDSLREKVLVVDFSDFFRNIDEDFTMLTIFSIFKLYRYEVPSLPTREKINFKNKPQLVLNITDSLISLSSLESLEYSKSTIISNEPSQANLNKHTTPKWNKEKTSEIIDDSTGYSMQPYEVSYETVSVANTSYTKKISDKLTKIEKANALCERKCMHVADLRTIKEQMHEVPSLKKLRIEPKTKNNDYICFLITPRLLKMLKPFADNFVFSVVLDSKNFSLKNENYFFEWKDFSLNIKGRISVNDISSCYNFGRILQIQTFSDELAVQCLDETEAALYVSSLNKLIKPKTLFSRDVSCNELILNIQ